ncbi:MAG: response regulator transcription factor [Pseudomonadota bacterium]
MANVVVVENDRIIARDLASIVESLGHKVAGVASNFADAVAIVDETSPDIVLLDIHIDGDRDGIAVAGELREEHSVALAFLTSHADHATVMKASIVRPNGYLIKPFDEASVDALLNTALANFAGTRPELAAEKIAGSNEGRPRSLPTAQRRKVEDYVGKRLDKPIKIEELAGLCGLSDSEFSRQFHASVGVSPYKYLMNERMKEAKRLLRNTDWSLAEIALAVGFSNQSHFTTSFRKALDTTPSAYRRFSR